jgi:glycosyltransferase involved in cell wall biosynthesis
LTLYLFYLCVLCLLIPLIYYIYFFKKLIFYKDEKILFEEPVSVIICAKNELENLQKNLPSFLNQNYKSFELIIVNDQSIDGTKYFLDEQEKKYNNLIIVHIDNHVKHAIGKKFALTLGIKTANFDNLLLSDADCKPISNNWIASMTQNFSNKEIILGYGKYKTYPGLLNKLIRYDTYLVAIQYFSYSLNSLTYMWVGRNLAYKKELFFNNKGFANHLHIPSGDDDLFINEIASKENVSINLRTNSFTTSEPEVNYFDWIKQKKRHLSTGKFYNFKIKFLLTLYPFSNIIFWTSFVLLFFLNFSHSILISILLLRLINSYISNYFLMKKLDVFDLFLIHPLLEFIHLINQLIFHIFNLIAKKKTWN